jgi:prepilin-type N-terminal cleavage/methylation domain-containing protein
LLQWAEKIRERMRRPHGKNHGFTLIELSIVLVVIGLIIGGVLVGQDLIKAAETRATLAQIEKYNSAVNTFKTKYNGIPGDLIYTDAANFGFTVGTGCAGQQGGRDGNGLLDGWTGVSTLVQGSGETGLFWQDLSSANLIDGVFPGGGGLRDSRI